MPETIGTLIVATLFDASVASTAIIGSVTVASVVGNIALAGALYGVNALLAEKPSASTQDGQLSVRQPVAMRRRNYGRVKIGGAIMFSETKSGTRFQILALNHGRIDQFEQLWMAEYLVVTDGTGNVTNTYMIDSSGGPVPCVNVKVLTGTDADAAFGDIVANFPEYWSADHQGKGIAKAQIFTVQPEAKDFTKVYPGGQPPVFRALVRAARVWDPRSGTQSKDNAATWTWTTNPVLIALDFHRHPDGMGMAPFDASYFTTAAINEDWITAANICDEAVALNAGGTEPRYACSGGYELPAPPKEILNAILATCDGQTYTRADGAIGIRVGKVVNPSITITDKHILTYSGFTRGSVTGLTAVNVLTAKYTAPDLDYQATDADPWRDEDSISETGREEARNIDLNWCCSHSQARRLMKAAFYRLNPEWSGQIVTDLDGLRAWNERYVTLQIEELGIDGPFEMVEDPQFQPASGTVVFSVRSITQSAYDWDPEHEEGTAPNQPDTSGTDDIDAPDNVHSSVSTGVITVTWDASGRIDTAPQLQYRTNPAGTWLAGSIASGTSGFTPTLSTAHYDVQVRFVVGSKSSGWTPLLNINVP